VGGVDISSPPSPHFFLWKAVEGLTWPGTGSDTQKARTATLGEASQLVDLPSEMGWLGLVDDFRTFRIPKPGPEFFEFIGT